MTEPARNLYQLVDGDQTFWILAASIIEALEKWRRDQDLVEEHEPDHITSVASGEEILL